MDVLRIKIYISNIDFDLCKIDPKYIKDIKGQESNSASPTDIWFITFNKEVYYNYTNPIKKAVFKIYINPDSIKTYYNWGERRLNSFRGLDYEFNIYKHKILPLIQNKICPNFITCIASGSSCSYTNLKKLLKYKIPENHLKRNIKYILNEQDNRPSIDNNINSHDIIDTYDANQLKYNIICTKSIDKTTTRTFKDILVERSIDERAILEIYFQISVSCYLMSLSKMMHNDLHFGNIFIEKLNEVETITYIINNKLYILNTQYKIYIYDFDRSFAVSLGNNVLLEDYCHGYFTCNEFFENYDIVRSLCILITYVSSKKTFVNKLSRCLSDIEYTERSIYEFAYFKKDIRRYKFYDTLTILNKIGSALKIDNTVKNIHNIQLKNVFICDKDENFDENGNFILNEEYYFHMLNEHLKIDIYDIEVNNLFEINQFRDINELSSKSSSTVFYTPKVSSNSRSSRRSSRGSRRSSRGLGGRRSGSEIRPRTIMEYMYNLFGFRS